MRTHQIPGLRSHIVIKVSFYVWFKVRVQIQTESIVSWPLTTSHSGSLFSFESLFKSDKLKRFLYQPSGFIVQFSFHNLIYEFVRGENVKSEMFWFIWRVGEVVRTWRRRENGCGCDGRQSKDRDGDGSDGEKTSSRCKLLFQNSTMRIRSKDGRLSVRLQDKVSSGLWYETTEFSTEFG